MTLAFWLKASAISLWLCPAGDRGWRWRLHLWTVERMGAAANWGAA